MNKTNKFIAQSIVAIFLFTPVSFVFAADTVKPTITSIARQTPSAETAVGGEVVWRVTFSEDVRNVDKADFALSGTAATPGEITAVKEISQSVYDVTAAAADGTLNLVVRTAVDDIQDLAGNAYDDAVGSSQGYVVKRPPTVTIDDNTLTDTVAITDTEITVIDDTAINASGVSVDAATTAEVSDFSCKQISTVKVVCTISIDKSGSLTIRAVDSAGNIATATQDGYVINGDIKIEKPALKLRDKFKRSLLSKKKRVGITKRSVTFSGTVEELKGGKVKIYGGKKKKLGEVKINSSTGKWKKTVKFPKDGKYRLYFKFYDKHGNKIDTLGGYKVRVDTEKPKFVDLPDKLTKRGGNRIWWIATDNDKIKRYRYEWRGRKIKTKKNHFFVPVNTPPGTYDLTVRAYDRAGNKTDKKVKVVVK